MSNRNPKAATTLASGITMISTAELDQLRADAQRGRDEQIHAHLTGAAQIRPRH